MSRCGWFAGISVVAILAGVAVAQESDPSSPYFDCPYINYFDSGCPQLEKEQARLQPPAEDEQEPPAAADAEEIEHDWLQEVPEHLLPLFPRESVAPDTPGLYRLLLTRPTLENARRYVRWYARRLKRMQEVQGLVEVAGRELLTEKARE